VTYVTDDNMLDTRTMGQFIILPDGKLRNGMAGYVMGEMPTLNRCHMQCHELRTQSSHQAYTPPMWHQATAGRLSAFKHQQSHVYITPPLYYFQTTLSSLQAECQHDLSLRFQNPPVYIQHSHTVETHLTPSSRQAAATGETDIR
jgi:hypothetical protein